MPRAAPPHPLVHVHIHFHIHLHFFLLLFAGPLLSATPLAPAPPGFALNEFVRHWEAAQYEHAVLGLHRARRDATSPSTEPLRLSFKAHHKEFHLQLRPDPNSVFADDVEFYNTHGPIAYSLGNVYSGSLEDDEYSYVHGIITTDGLFDGTIYTNHEIYYIEPLHRHDKSHPKIHSAIYKTTDVINPSSNSTSPCASHLLHMAHVHKASTKHQRKKNHNSMNQGTIVNYISDFDKDVDSLLRLKRDKRWLPDDDDNAELSTDPDDDEEVTPLRNPSLPIDLYVPYYSENEDSNLENVINRIKNSTDRTRGILFNTYDEENDGESNSRPNSKNHVEIKSKINIQNDVINKKPVGFTIVSSLLGNVTDSALRHVNKRATIDPKKTTCMLYLQADHQFFQKFGSEEACIEVMTRHVQRVNSIYRVTDFNQDGKPDNITFMIKRIKVHTAEALKDPLYRFPNNYGVEKFLELFSEEDYDGFCLAYMFTYRDFEMGTLGLAWTGDLKNAGGVCEKNGHYRGSLKSLNTGIVTLLNYGKHVPPAVSHVTLAHEIGHNFGSPHDPDVCTPGGEDGNFIMFARATSGDKKNNNQFSPCSLKSINPVLNNKARSSKGCFTEPQVSLCGNGVVEEGEECDCGWEGDCREPCCHPQRRHPPPGEVPCRLTPRSVCSPSQGPCCTAQCSLRFGDECRSDNGCRDSSHCDGRRPHCPPSASKPNRTVCDDGFVCYMGECTGSICLAYGLESCQCSSDRACDLCCRQPGPGNPCRSSFQWNTPPYDVPDMYAKPGTPCNDYNGYCDVFQKCREVDPSGPLATLRKLLLSEESLLSLKKWIWEHWYAVALIILAVIGLLVGSTRLLGKKSDGKMKSVTIIHSSTTETVRLPEHCPEGVIVHTAVRSKLPLKKKVALKHRHRKKKDKTRENDQTHANGIGKNKKRLSAPVATEELHKHGKDSTSHHVEAIAVKLRKPGSSKHKTIIAKRKSKHNKEVIDYSAAQKDVDQQNIPTSAVPIVAEADSLGKVQNWLLNNPRQPIITKSKSTPVGLTDRAYGNKGISLNSKSKSKHEKNSKSVNNLVQGENDKFKLQVIYKPPFKFSLKLCKGDKSRIVLDKTTHTRQEHSKKKSHGRLSKADDGVNRLSKHTIDPVAIVTNDALQTQSSQLSNMATVGLNHEAESTHYEQVGNNLSNEDRQNQYHKAFKWTHKKSSSVGQGNELGESHQNLLQDQSNSNINMHFYENVVSNDANLDEIVTRANKTSSMPRNITLRNPNRAIFRQSSHNVLPSNRSGNPQRTSQRISTNANNRHIKKSFSNASQRNDNHIQKGNSLNNLHVDSKRNSLSQKKRSSMAADQVYSNVDAMERNDEKQKRLLKLNGVDSVVGNKNLRRQMSASELYKSPAHGDFFMPMSAGANYTDACRPEFEWIQNRINSTDNEVPLRLPDSRMSRDCLESQIVPNINDNQTPLENNVENPSKRSSASKVLPSGSSAQKRQQVPKDDPSMRGLQGPTNQWPYKFGELKHTLPDTSQVSDMGVYQSDMEVLVSDNDYSLEDV